MPDTEEKLGVLATFRKLASGHGNPIQIKVYTLAFVLVITAFFGGAVSALNFALNDYKLLNQKVSEQTVILNLFNLIEKNKSISAEETNKRFEEKIQPIVAEGINFPYGKDGKYIYYKTKGGESELYAFPVWGSGFWEPIVGYLAVDENSGKITGIDFVQHAETPGLGGRISEPDVRNRFIGKDYKSVTADGKHIMIVGEGKSIGDPNAVDGITGATGTSTKLEALLNKSIETFVNIRKKAAK